LAHRSTTIVGILLAGLAAGGAWYFAQHRGGAQELILYGNVDIRQVDLAFNAEGPLLKLEKEEGDVVRAGELLAELEPDVYENLVSLASARVDAQQAALDKALAGNRKEDIERAQADAAAARATMENDRITFQRKAELLSTASGSRQAYDDAKAAFDEATARTLAVDKAAEVMRLGSRQEDIDGARAALQADRAALALAENRLARTKLHAPADGVILSRIAEPGAILAPTSPVYTLAMTDRVWVRSYVPEAALGQAVPGRSVSVHTDSRPGTAYHGWIGYVAPTAEFTPKSIETPELRTQLVYRLRIFVTAPDDGLRQGMPVTIRLDPAKEDAP